jgi:hypothetical protein
MRARDPSYYAPENIIRHEQAEPIEERKGESISLVSDFDTYRARRDLAEPVIEEAPVEEK